MICYRTCAHVLCLAVVVGPEGALCEACQDAEQVGDGPTCSCCDNDSEDVL